MSSTYSVFMSPSAPSSKHKFFFPPNLHEGYHSMGMGPSIDPLAELFRGLSGPAPETPATDSPVVKPPAPVSDRQTRSRTRAGVLAEQASDSFDDTLDSVPYAPELFLPQCDEVDDFPQHDFSLADFYYDIPKVCNQWESGMGVDQVLNPQTSVSSLGSSYGALSSVASTSHSISPLITPPSLVSNTSIAYVSPAPSNSYLSYVPFQAPKVNNPQESNMDVDQVQDLRGSPSTEPAPPTPSDVQDLCRSPSPEPAPPTPPEIQNLRGSPSPDPSPPTSPAASIPEALLAIESLAPVIHRQTRAAASAALATQAPPAPVASSNASSSAPPSVAFSSTRTNNTFKVTRTRGHDGKFVASRSMRTRSTPASTAATSIGSSPDPNDIFKVTLGRDGKSLYYTCKTCPNYKTNRLGDVGRHVEKTVHKKPSYTCSVCNATMTRIDVLRRHFISKKHKKNDKQQLSVRGSQRR